MQWSTQEDEGLLSAALLYQKRAALLQISRWLGPPPSTTIMYLSKSLRTQGHLSIKTQIIASKYTKTLIQVSSSGDVTPKSTVIIEYAMKRRASIWPNDCRSLSKGFKGDVSPMSPHSSWHGVFSCHSSLDL